MNYEKKYKEALERAKEIIECSKSDTKEVRMVLSFFPELADSKDERIRKDIVAAVETYGDFTQGRKEEIYAWLEKQGEQKGTLCDTCRKAQPSHSCQDITALGRCALEKQGELKPVKVPKFKAGDFIQFNGIGHTRYTVKEVCGLSHYINTCNKRMDMSYTDANFELVEQKPWSEEDEKDFDIVRGIIYNSCNAEDASRLIEWLKSLKDRVQPKQEWSEEDENMINSIIRELIHQYNEEIPQDTEEKIKWLKNMLKFLRPQSRWKPSGEQIYTLKKATNIVGSKYKSCLNSLYSDLIKLREE